MMDGGAIIKPALGRARLRCIGATPIDKFKKTIEKDPGLERRWGGGGGGACLWWACSLPSSRARGPQGG
jgi:hypothetical protein